MMTIRPQLIESSDGSRDPEGLAYVYCRDESGYCVSICWKSGDALAEVMVVDQVNHQTREVAVELHRDRLIFKLSRECASHLDGITEYFVLLSGAGDQLQRLDSALSAILANGRGNYIRQI